MLRTQAVSGNLNTVRTPVAASVGIVNGDAIIEVSGVGTPAANLTTTGLTTLALMQAAVHDAFLGISLDQRLASQDKAGNILTATAGRFSMPCADSASAYNIGQLFGFNGTLANSVYTPKNQEVVAVASEYLAIGRVAKAVAAHATTVELEIVSTMLTGGPQAAEAAAASGSGSGS